VEVCVCAYGCGNEYYGDVEKLWLEFSMFSSSLSVYTPGVISSRDVTQVNGKSVAQGFREPELTCTTDFPNDCFSRSIRFWCKIIWKTCDIRLRETRLSRTFPVFSVSCVST